MDADLEVADDSYIKNRNNKEKSPLWDSFQDPPSKKASGSATNWTKLSLILKIFKLFTYIVVFVVVLATAVISKISFILMVAQINDKTSVQYCNIHDHKGDYVVHLPLEEQIVWIWALIFSFAAPEVFTFIRSLRFCIFKDVKSPTRLEVLLVILFELLHVIGLGMLTFFVSPQLDSVRALMLYSGTCFVPAILSEYTWSI